MIPKLQNKDDTMDMKSVEWFPVQHAATRFSARKKMSQKKLKKRKKEKRKEK